MGSLFSKRQRIENKQWVFPIQEAVRQVVPPEYIADRNALQDVNDEELATTRAVEVSTALRKTQQDATSDRPDQTDSTTRTSVKFYKYFADWLPRLAIGPAWCLLILNILLPGLGTMFFSLKWYSPEDFIIPTTKSQRSAIVLTCLLYGFMQLLLAPFLFGWLWSIATGIICIQQAKWVAISESYSHVIENRLKEMLTERVEQARVQGRLMQAARANNAGPLSDISMASSRAHSGVVRSTPNQNSAGIQGRTVTPTVAAFASLENPHEVKEPLNFESSSNTPSTRRHPENLAPNKPLTNNSIGRPKTPTTTPKAKRANDVHPGQMSTRPTLSSIGTFSTSTGGAAETSPGDLDSIPDDPFTGASVLSPEPASTPQHPPGSSGANSRASSHKSRKSALSLSQNRISPAPTPASSLILTQQPSPEDETPSKSLSSAKRDNSSAGGKSVSFSKTVDEPQTKGGAWSASNVVTIESSGGRSTSPKKSSSSAPELDHTTAPFSMYGDNEDTSDDDVIIDMANQRNQRQRSVSSERRSTKAEDLEIEDI